MGVLIDYCGAWVILIAAAIAGATGAILSAVAPTLNLVIVGYGVFIGRCIYHLFVRLITYII